MTKEIAIKENYSIEKIKDMTSMGQVLKTYVVKEKLYTNIKGKNYAHVEGWQFAGGLLGMYPQVVQVESLSNGNEIKWKAEVAIINSKTDKVVSRGYAICSNKENTKNKFDEYAILSMAQTRAIGKAYRNLIGWVMKLAGYEGTPSEEMHKVGETPKEVPEISYDAPQQATELKKGQVIGPDKKPTYICSVCKDPINDQTAEYSQKMFGKKLCRDHQPKKK